MKTCIVYNRTSGPKPGTNLFQSSRKGLPHSSIDILESQKKGHNEKLASDAVKKGNRIVIAAGGDGTINEIINGIAGSNAALSLIPTGTANDLATNMRMSDNRLDILKNPDRYCTKKIDLIWVNGRYFVTVGGFGLASDAAAWSNRIRNNNRWTGNLARRAGSLTYVMSSLAVYPAYRSRPIRVQIESKKRVRETEVFSLMLANQPFFGKWFHIAPKASNTDGLIDICLINNTKSLVRSVEIIGNVMAGTHLQKPYVTYWQDDQITISSERPIAFFGDGEIFEMNTRFNVRLVPQALTVMVPKPEAGLSIITGKQSLQKHDLEISNQITLAS